MATGSFLGSPFDNEYNRERQYTEQQERAIRQQYALNQLQAAQYGSLSRALGASQIPQDSPIRGQQPNKVLLLLD